MGRIGTVGVLTVLCAVVAVGVYIESHTVSREAAREAATAIAAAIHASEKRQLIKVCERNNVFKANTRINIHQGLPSGVGRLSNRRRNDVLMPILNCVATFEHGGRGVPLTHDEERRFMDVVAKGKVPIMSREGGAVIGGREPEQGGLADF